MAASASGSFRRIVWPLAIAETIVWAAMYYAFPALLLEWERDLGWSKTELSGALTLALVVSAVMTPVAGRFIDRGFARRILAGSAVLGALALIALSQVTQIWQFYAVWFVLGIAMAGCLYDSCFAVLTRSMGERAKQAITLVALVAGFAGTVSFPSAHILAGAFGWRGAVVVFALAVLFVAAPLIWFASRRADRHDETQKTAPATSKAEGLRILRIPTFWLLGLLFLCIALNHGVLLTHMLPMLDERGVHKEAAVLAASMIGPMQVAGRLAMMAAERHVSTTIIFMACMVALAIASLSVFGAGAIPALVVSFVLFQGAGYGVTSILRPLIVAEYLGRANFGMVAGGLATAFLLGNAGAPTIAALIWEGGGYDRVILFALAISGIGLLALLAAARLAARPGGKGGG